MKVVENEKYLPLTRPIFDQIDNGSLIAVTSPITLAECLVHPTRLNQAQLCQDFIDVIVNAENTIFIPLEQAIAQRAAQLRAEYNLTLTDAFQIATALITNCKAFLTNDSLLKRVVELKIIVLDELTGS